VSSERNQQLATRLHSAAIRMLRMLRREDESSGLSAPRLSALSVIVFSGPISLAELAAAEQVRPPTMTRLVEALVQDSLVTRTVDERDRRVVRISATEAGKLILEEGRRRRVEALTRRLGGLADSEMRALLRGVELLERVIR
jgi:DNA-binding MarR family transcriptional regulator